MPYPVSAAAPEVAFRYTVVVVVRRITAAIVTVAGSTPVPVVTVGQELAAVPVAAFKYAVIVPAEVTPPMPTTAHSPAPREMELRLYPVPAVVMVTAAPATRMVGGAVPVLPAAAAKAGAGVATSRRVAAAIG
jgi:hypothetical protein